MKNIETKYAYRVEWSDEDGVYIASCAELPTLKAHGGTMGKALANIRTVVRTTLKWMRDEKEEIPPPLSTRKFRGHLTLRTSPEIHRQLSLRAVEQGVSINQYILSKAMGG